MKEYRFIVATMIVLLLSLVCFAQTLPRMESEEQHITKIAKGIRLEFRWNGQRWEFSDPGENEWNELRDEEIINDLNDEYEVNTRREKAIATSMEHARSVGGLIEFGALGTHISSLFGWEVNTLQSAVNKFFAGWAGIDEIAGTVCESWNENNPTTAVLGVDGLPAAHIEGRKLFVNSTFIGCEDDDFCKEFFNNDNYYCENACRDASGNIQPFSKNIYKITFSVDPSGMLIDDSGDDFAEFGIFMDDTQLDLDGDGNADTIKIELEGDRYSTGTSPLLRRFDQDYKKVCIEFTNMGSEYTGEFRKAMKRAGDEDKLCNSFAKEEEFDVPAQKTIEFWSFSAYGGFGKGESDSGTSGDGENRPSIKN